MKTIKKKLKEKMLKIFNPKMIKKSLMKIVPALKKKIFQAMKIAAKKAKKAKKMTKMYGRKC